MGAHEEEGLRTLTKREREVLALMAAGLTNEAIRLQLWISPKTLECHIGRIYCKLGLDASRHHPRVRAAVLWLLANDEGRLVGAPRTAVAVAA